MLYILISIAGITSIVIFLILYIPIWIEINSLKDEYRIRWGKLIIMGITPTWEMYMTFFGYRRIISLKSPPHKKLSRPKSKRSERRKIKFRSLLAVLKSFEIKRWDIQWDMGDMALNGKIFPIFYFISKLTGKPTSINFIGKNQIVITVRNSVYRILHAYIKSINK